MRKESGFDSQPCSFGDRGLSFVEGKEFFAGKVRCGCDMEQVGAAATDPRIVGLTQSFRLAQNTGPVNRLVNQDCLFLQICLHLLELNPALMWINDALENRQANGVTNLEPMPRSERKRPAVALHEGGR